MMEKAFEMGKTSVTGSFQLLIGVAGSTIIMAVGTVIMTRLLSPAEYGLYGVALIPSFMINLFRDWGINSAMAKYVANYRASEKEADTRNVVVAGLIFEVATGLVLLFLSLFLAGYIGSTIFHRPESVSLISIVAITIFAGSLLTAAQSSFIGFERMGLYSFTSICQSVVKTIAGPILVLLGYGVLGAVLGYTLSFLAAGIIGLTTLYLVLFRNLKKLGSGKLEISRTLKTMLKYGVPLSISSILSGLLGQFYAFMMASFASDVMIGNYSASVNFSVLLAFFTIPIGTVLFPAFAKLDPKKEHQLLITVFTSSVKYTALLLVPATMAIIILSGPMISTLFGERYVYAPFFLTLYVIGNLFAVLGSLSLNSLLAGVGETRMLMKQSILTLTIGLPLGLLLIPTLGITGLIVAGIIAGIPSMFWGLYWIWKHYKTKADFRCSAKILAASAIATVVAYLPVTVLNTANWIKLVIGLVIFLAVYIFATPLVGAVSRSDIKNLKAMFSGLSVISRLINIPLILADKVLTFSKDRSLLKHTRESKIKHVQDKLLKDNYDLNAKKVIVFLTPGFDDVNGGILSISSIYEETEKLKDVHEAETILCTIPGDPLLLKYTKFKNRNRIYNFPLILSFFQKVQNLTIHIPEYCIDQFLKNISARDYGRLTGKDVHINILLQNIQLLSPMESIESLGKLGRLTCTTAHEKYSTLELRKRLGMPLHKLSTYVSPEKYSKKKYAEKENLMVVSPDTHPKKAEVLSLIAEQFPELGLQIITNLTYEEYKKVISRAKWALTFGEGLDNYFLETVFSGGISFSAYNSRFFTEDFKSLRTVYDNYDVLIRRICADIKDLDNETAYTDYNEEQYALCSKHYDYREYVKRLEAFYREDYTYK